MRTRAVVVRCWLIGVAFTGAAPQIADARPPTPALSVPAVTAEGIWRLDPQLAVGRKYVAAIDSSNVGFYDKATMHKVTIGPAFPYAQNPIPANSLFGSFFKVIDAQLKLKPNVCNDAIPNFDQLFDPAAPNKAIPGCISDAYDTRVFYDAPRHRFWIESAVRNPLWTCPGGAGMGNATLDPDATMTTWKCHTDWQGSWPHRFIAVAVSQVDANGQEDLSKPFHKYALVDEYQDWPTMSVHGRFLLLGHQHVGASVAVFDANALAAGVNDNTSMVVKPLATFPAKAFGAAGVAPAGLVYLVTGHGPATEPSYVISGDGHNKLFISGIAPGKLGKPILLTSATVILADGLQSSPNNAVYRNGKLYVADSWWAGTICKSRVLRVPVSVNGSDTAVVASTDVAHGFTSYTLNSPLSDMSYIFPAIEVNGADDAVVVFLRGRPPPSAYIPWSARYSTLYHGQTLVSFSNLLHDAVWSTTDGVPTSIAQIDLGGIAVDPSDDRTIWMSHAYTNGTDFTQVVGAVKP